MNNKRGQFYLIAAIIIIAIIVGFAAVTNFYKKGGVEEKKIYYLANELDVEGSYVIDYSVYNSQDSTALLRTFAEEYGKYAGENRNIYFVFGDKNKFIVATYDEYISGTIGFSGTGTELNQDIHDKNFKTKTCDATKIDQDENCGLNSGSDTIQFTIDQDGEKIPYTFDLNEGENFYFIISQDIPGRGRIVLDKPTNEGGRIKLAPSGSESNDDEGGSKPK